MSLPYGKFCLTKEYTMHIEYYKDGTSCECDEMRRDYYSVDGSTWTEIPYVNGKEHGIGKEYYGSGALSIEIPYVNGRAHGLRKEYYESGALGQETPYVSGRIHGKSRDYFKTGNLWTEVSYTNDKRHGISKAYHESGALVAVSIYKHGNFCPMDGCPIENFS
jgi:antitoxin component YwqK of YwqJK toxin-antitoxin module